MRGSIPLLTAVALLGGQVALGGPATADSALASVAHKAASAPAKKGKRGPVLGKLRVDVTGAPRGRVVVRNAGVRRTVSHDATLRIPTGTYRVRAGAVRSAGDDYRPQRKSWRVQVKRGATSIVTAEYTRVGGSSGGSFAPESAPTGDMAVLFDLVNQARTTTQQCGARTMPAVDPVNWDEDLALAARQHAQDMAEKNYFEHDSLDGRSFADRIEGTGYDGYPGGENIAMGFQSAKDALQGWLKSPGHCTNLMDPDFVDMGLGYAARTDVGYTLPSTYWVQDFGYGL